MSTEKIPTVYATKMPIEEKTPKDKKINCTKTVFSWLLAALLVALIVALCVQFLVPVKKYESAIDEVHVYKGKPIEIEFKPHSNSNGPIADDILSPPWHLDFLINPTRLCDALNAPDSEAYLKDPEVKLLMLVPSAVSHFQHRMTIRRTWGSVAEKPHGPFRLGFVLGTSPNSTVEDLIKEESVNYGDIIQADFKDTYQNLTTKSVLMLKWVSKHCAHAQYFLKADDDTFVNMGQLTRLLQQPPFTTNDNFIGGFINKGAMPSRNPIVKYYVTEYDYLYDELPPYASGSAYVTNGATASKLFEASKQMKPFLPMEDVFVTGLCGDSIDVTLIHEPSFRHRDPPEPRTWDTYRYLTTVHSIPPDDMDDLWDEMLEDFADMLGWSGSSESSESSFFPVSSEFSDSSSDFFWSWPGRKSFLGDSDWDSSEMDISESSYIKEGVANKGKPIKIIQEDIFGPTFLSFREIKPKEEGVISNKGQAVFNPFKQLLEDFFPRSVPNSREIKLKADKDAENRRQTILNPFSLLEGFMPPMEIKPKVEKDATNKGQAALNFFQFPRLEDYLPPSFPNFQKIKPLPESNVANKGQSDFNLFKMPRLEDYLPSSFVSFQEIKPMAGKDTKNKGQAASNLFQMPMIEDFLPPDFPYFEEMYTKTDGNTANKEQTFVNPFMPRMEDFFPPGFLNFQESKSKAEEDKTSKGQAVFKPLMLEDSLPPNFLNFQEIKPKAEKDLTNKGQTFFNPFTKLLKDFFPSDIPNFQESRPKFEENKMIKNQGTVSNPFKPPMLEDFFPPGILTFQEIKPNTIGNATNKRQIVFNPFTQLLKDFFPSDIPNFHESRPKVEENKMIKNQATVFNPFKLPMLEDFFPPGILTSQEIKPNTTGNATNKEHAFFNPFKPILENFFPPDFFNLKDSKPKVEADVKNQTQTVSNPFKPIPEDIFGPFPLNFREIKPNVQEDLTTKGQTEPITSNWIEIFPGPNFLNSRINKGSPLKQIEKEASFSHEKKTEHKILPIPLNNNNNEANNTHPMFFN